MSAMLVVAELTGSYVATGLPVRSFTINPRTRMADRSPILPWWGQGGQGPIRPAQGSSPWRRTRDPTTLATGVWIAAAISLWSVAWWSRPRSCRSRWRES